MRGLDDPEFELLDTGLFDQGRYFDVEIAYAKAAPDDILMRVTATNRGPDAADLTLLPQLWARNTWSWKQGTPRPELMAGSEGSVWARHPEMPTFRFFAEGAGDLLFTENETNTHRLFGSGPAEGFYKDGINFEGPAPRPLERFAIRIADDGQLEIDKSKLFQEEIGQWNDPASYVPV